MNELLEFSNKGFLIPSSNITVSLEDFRTTFVSNFQLSKTREKLFENYIIYSNELKQTLNLKELKQWINGSFVTKVVNPKDVDLVTFVPKEVYFKKEKELKKFKELNWFELNIDAYIIIERQNYSFESDKMYWMNHFSRTRKNTKTGKRLEKGFIEINY